MDRRAFISGITLALLAAPLGAESQAVRKVWRIGIITISSSSLASVGPEPSTRPIAALLHGLRDLGYVYGRDFVTEPAAAEGRIERIPALAAELARLKVDVIVAPGPALAGLKAARITIPIVMAGAVTDPVQAGLATSLARPGGNFTGLSLLIAELDRKRLELLTEIVPGASRVAVLRGPDSEHDWNETQAAARLLRRELLSVEVKTPDEINGAFRTATEWRAHVVLVIAGALLDREARRVVEQAARHRLPAAYSFRNFYMEEGGLMSYGVDLLDVWRRAASYVDKIVKGAQPGDLPVEQATKFELIINLKTAKALGLTIPQSLLLRADQVIE